MTTVQNYLKKKKFLNILSDGSTYFNTKFALKNQTKYCMITQDLNNNQIWVKSTLNNELSRIKDKISPKNVVSSTDIII